MTNANSRLQKTSQHLNTLVETDGWTFKYFSSNTYLDLFFNMFLIKTKDNIAITSHSFVPRTHVWLSPPIAGGLRGSKTPPRYALFSSAGGAPTFGGIGTDGWKKCVPLARIAKGAPLSLAPHCEGNQGALSLVGSCVGPLAPVRDVLLEHSRSL